MRICSLIMVSVLAMGAGCSRTPVITVKNQSPLAISNVVVSGSGFTNHIATIAAGAEDQLTVQPRGDSGVRVAFDAGTQHIDSGTAMPFKRHVELVSPSGAP